MLTHGHEDHVGALPYLLRETRPAVPVYGTAVHARAAQGQARGARGRATSSEPRCSRCRARALTVGPFSMRFLHVTHSIPDGMAVAVDTPHGTVLHTGDFKIDPTPIDGRPTDLHGLAEEAAGGRARAAVGLHERRGARAHRQRAERRPGAARHRRERARASWWSACFSSHIHRIQQVVDAAVADGRVVAFLGRSMQNRVGAARRLGNLHVDDRDVIDIAEVDRLDPGRVVVDLHRVAGRAVLGALPDGRARAQVGEAQGGRHGRAVLEPDPRERAGDPPGGRRAVPERRRRLPRARRRRCTRAGTRRRRSSG